MTDIMSRVLADSRDRPAWLGQRIGRVGASNAASFSKEESVPLYVKALINNAFQGNAYTNHGNDRERAILRAYHLEQNTLMFAAAGNARHVATPDAFKRGGDGSLVLAQVKTSVKPLHKLPPTYQRQMWFEQYVMETDRTLFIWEQHEGFQPLAMEPESQWFYRDDAAIAKLVHIADLVLEAFDIAAQFRREMES